MFKASCLNERADAQRRGIELFFCLLYFKQFCLNNKNYIDHQVHLVIAEFAAAPVAPDAVTGHPGPADDGRVPGHGTAVRAPRTARHAHAHDGAGRRAVQWSSR